MADDDRIDNYKESVEESSFEREARKFAAAAVALTKSVATSATEIDRKKRELLIIGNANGLLTYL